MGFSGLCEIYLDLVNDFGCECKLGLRVQTTFELCISSKAGGNITQYMYLFIYVYVLVLYSGPAVRNIKRFHGANLKS